jgi:thioredoxin 1
MMGLALLALLTADPWPEVWPPIEAPPVFAVEVRKPVLPPIVKKAAEAVAKPVRKAIEAVKPDRPVVVYRFTATWCQPCRWMQPVVDRLRARGVTVYDIDIDQYPAWWRATGARQIPHWQVDRGGEFFGSFTGQVSEAQVLGWIQAAKGQP